ncbi:MAG TPA: thymidine phosphorylase [Clostridiaceae bacterium]|nr:thymidine phosphorylase [Clostridiaceae bacterium]
MNMVDLIMKKRNGEVLSQAEINFFITEYVQDRIPDYQAAALLMAIWFRGMDKRETGELTVAMTDSGDKIDLSAIHGIKVDKHSTGGVGDKTTLIIVPIVAACGVPVAKLSGRSLGHTGGTIDKLESIPGISTSLTIDDFIRQVQEIGLALAGQTANLAPADKKLYALRDVTATVDQLSLIASSIMSKKLASGADKIVLDVKTGSGAFMKTVDEAVELAKAMVDIADHAGKETIALVTDMDRPLGRMIGNSLEVEEALAVLRGEGPVDLIEVCNLLAANMLYLAGQGSLSECADLAKEAVSSGRALEKFALMIAAQGGDADYIRGHKQLERAGKVHDITAPISGYIHYVETDDLGKAAGLLGAARLQKDTEIDHQSGIILHKTLGDYVVQGEPLVSLLYNKTNSLDEACNLALYAFEIKESPAEPRPVLLARVTANSIER